jgi:hypothetical protein
METLGGSNVLTANSLADSRRLKQPLRGAEEEALTLSQLIFGQQHAEGEEGCVVTDVLAKLGSGLVPHESSKLKRTACSKLNSGALS